MVNKRGQFFLVAALVIVGILIGLAGVYTQVNTAKEDSSVYDLSSELNYESLQVIDQGTYSGISQDQVGENILNLSNYYVDKNPQKDFAIIYGDKSSITVLAYTATTVGQIGTSTGGTPQSHTIKKSVLRTDTNEHDDDDNVLIGDAIVVKFKGKSYTFTAGAGTSFYSVLSSQVGNTTTVSAQGNAGPKACSGTAPSSSWILSGAATYPSTFTGTKTWNYITAPTNAGLQAVLSASLTPCQWSCSAGHIRKSATENKCKNT